MDLQLINIFFVIRSGSLQGNEASKQKDPEAGQIPIFKWIFFAISSFTKTEEITYMKNEKNDLQLINIFFVIRSGSLQGNEASKQKDSETGQIEAVEAMVVMMLQTHNNNFDDSNLTKIVLITIISQISNFPILLWENKFSQQAQKNLVKPQKSLVSPLVLTRIFGTFGRWRPAAPWRYLSQLRLMIRQLSPTQLCKFHVYIIHTLLLFYTLHRIYWTYILLCI